MSEDVRRLSVPKHSDPSSQAAAQRQRQTHKRGAGPQSGEREAARKHEAVQLKRTSAPNTRSGCSLHHTHLRRVFVGAPCVRVLRERSIFLRGGLLLPQHDDNDHGGDDNEE